MKSKLQHSPWRVYLLIGGLLLLQLWLRSSHPLAMPAYADESLHIRRAQIAWDFKDAMASWLPRKLLLYYYLGLFEVPRVDYLQLSRVLVPLFTLLGGAAIYGIGRKLSQPLAGMLALGLYVVAPFTLFFDRMVLADPIVMTVMLITVWWSLFWIEKPTVRASVGLGVLLILTPFAKLTAIAILALPPFMILLFQPHQWKSYLRPLAIIYGLFAAVWIPLLTPTILGGIEGGDDRVVLVEDYLLNIHEKDQNFIENALDSTYEAFAQTTVYLSLPLMLAAGLGLGGLLWLKPRWGLWLGGVFFLAWLPSIVAGSFPYTRYLEIGIPYLLLMAAVGLVELSHKRQWLIVGVLLYALLWGLPFWWQATTEPENLNLPREDRWRYVQSTTSGYGQVEAMGSALAEGNLAEPIQIYGILGSCHTLRLYLPDDEGVVLTCAEMDYEKQMPLATVEKIYQTAQMNGWMYILLERELSSNFDDLAVEWTFIRTFPRPHAGIALELWRVTPTTPPQPQPLPALPNSGG